MAGACQPDPPCRKRLTDGSYLSRLYASPKHRRHDQGGLVVRVIDYRLDGVPDADPLYRLITTLLEPSTAPAAELAALYHERWESEGTFAELKVALPGRRLLLRSRLAALVEQELYGLVLVHLALRRLMTDASSKAGVDPDTLSFLHTVRIVRRHVPFHAAFPPRRRRRMMALLLLEIIAVPAEQSRGRHNPRVVKRKMSKFPTKARAAPASSARPRLRYTRHIQIVAPAVPETPPPAAAPSAPVRASAKRAPRGRPKAAPDPCCEHFWLDHVRAWRASNLTRMAYCECQQLDPRNFNAWVARLRDRFRRSSNGSKRP